MNEIILEPNIFQRDIYDFIRDENRGNLIVRALAGTGKTYTGIESLNLIPRNKKVIFLAYNRHIVTELEGKAPDWVEVRTTHATGLSTIKNFNIGKTTNHWDHNYKMFNILREIIKEDNVKFKKKRNDAEIISDAKFSRIRSGIVNIVNHFRNSLLVVNMYEMEYITDRYDIDFKEVEITQERIFKLVEEVLKRDMQDTLSVDYGDMLYLPTMMMMEFERYDFVFVDECLPGRTRILLSNGEEKTISEIVEKQLSVDVVSYNTKTKNRQNKKIIGWSKKPTNNKVMLKITHAEKRKVPENDEEYYPHHILFCTDNHLVFTKEHGFVHSSDLKPGKHVKSESAHGSSCWSEIIFVEEVEYKEEFVYDIEIEDNHNFYAEGVLVHNCQDLNESQLRMLLMLKKPNGRIIAIGDTNQALYAFRGADTNAMEKIKLATDAEELPLNICYRCPKIQIKLAQEYVPEMEYAPDAIDGEVRVISGDIMHKYIKPGDIAICRNNAPLVSPALGLLKLGIKVNIRGQNLKKSMIDLIKKTKTNDLLIMTDMIIEYRETEAERLKQEGKNPVSMLDKVGVILEFAKESEDVNDLIHYIDTLMNDKDKEITFSTIHSAKGLEAENIFFINSWLIPTPWASKDWEFQGERNIMYVALTRAKNRTYFVDIHDEPPTEAIVNKIEKRNDRITEAINEVFTEQQEVNTNDLPLSTAEFDEDYLKKILEKENGKRRS